MMRKCCLILVACIAVVGSARAADQVAGSAYCVHDTVPRSCQATWKWDKAVGRYQQLQRFDLDAATWVTEQDLISSPSGTSQALTRPAHLYRVQACRDPEEPRTCESSTAFWSPKFPARVNDVPEFVVTGRGRILGVSKALPLETVTAQYNVYLMVTALEGVDMKVMPPMTPPTKFVRFSDDASAWNDLEISVYEEYSGLQQISKSKSLSTKQPGLDGQRPEFIDEVPESARAAFRAERLTGWPASTSIDFPAAGRVAHTITVFADIDCQHCRQIFHDLPELAKFGIQVRFMAFPIAGIDSPAGEKMTDIWCSADPTGAFEQAIRGKPIPHFDCGKPIVPFHYALGRRMGLQGSPSIVSERGEYIGGYLSPSDLAARLSTGASTADP